MKIRNLYIFYKLPSQRASNPIILQVLCKCDLQNGAIPSWPRTFCLFGETRETCDVGRDERREKA